MKLENKEEIREDFCAPCLALIPLAFSGAGAGVSATMTDDEKDKHKHKHKQKMKDIIFWSSIVVGVISLFIFILFRYILCTKCR